MKLWEVQKIKNILGFEVERPILYWCKQEGKMTSMYLRKLYWMTKLHRKRKSNSKTHELATELLYNLNEHTYGAYLLFGWYQMSYYLRNR